MRGLASKSQLRMSLLRYALVTVPALLLLGTISGTLAGSGAGNPWFDALEKPAIMPPGWVFGAAWTLLYILLGIALALILHARGARGRAAALAFFFAQLVLNYAWSPIFFAAHAIGTAFVTILAMIVLSLIAALLFGRIRRTAGLLMLPYIAWLIFAAILTWQIGTLNPQGAAIAEPEASADIRL